MNEFFAKLFGWKKLSEIFPLNSGYFQVMDVDGVVNIGVYDKNLEKFVDDCSEFGLNGIVYWRHWS